MDPIVITDPEKILLVRMGVLKQGLKLELLGMYRRGKSAFSIVKEEFGLRGSRTKIYEQFCKLYEEARESVNG